MDGLPPRLKMAATAFSFCLFAELDVHLRAPGLALSTTSSSATSTPRTTTATTTKKNQTRPIEGPLVGPRMPIDFAPFDTHEPTNGAPCSPTASEPSRLFSTQTFNISTKNVHRDFAKRTSVADVRREIEIIRKTTTSPWYLKSWFQQTSQKINVFDQAPSVRVLSGRIEDVWPSKYIEYTLECQYREFKWTIEIPKSSIYGLWFYVKSSTMTSFRHSGVSTGSSNLASRPPPLLPTTLPSLSRFFLANAEKSITNEMLLLLQRYFNRVLSVPLLLSSPYVLSLLQVSCSTFDDEQGKTSIREGWLKVRVWIKGDKENLRINHLAMSCDNECFNCMCVVKRFSFKSKKARWVALKHSAIVVYNSIESTNAKEVFLFDPKFTIESGIQHVGSNAALLVTNSTFVMQLEAKSKQAIMKWAVDIRKIVEKCDWAHPQRDDAYAIPRSPYLVPSYAKWLVDGDAAYEAIYQGLLSAQNEIFIAGWCLCPELHLRRPGLMHSESRLDRILLRKAQEGVMIYVLIYKEIAVALDLGSSYAKRVLRKLHPNVFVLRDPDFLVKQWGMWSHHEKIVSIDQRVTFVGGLDLCFGRYDTASHVLFDNPYDAPQMTKFIGKDFYNPRIRETAEFNQAEKDSIDRRTEPRMPWHDVHCRLEGQPARDVARHFIQRWNYSVSTRAKRGKLFPLVPRQEMRKRIRALGDSCSQLLDDRLQLASHSVRSFRLATGKKLPAVQKSGGFSCRITEDVREEEEEEKVEEHAKLPPIQTRVPSNVPASDQIQAELSPTKSDVDGSANPTSPVPSATSCGPFSPSPPSSPKSVGRTQSRFFRENSQTPLDEQGVGPDTEDLSLSPEDREKAISTRGHPCHIQICRSLSLWSGGCPTERSIQNAYIRLISQANHFIYIENQFFVSGLDGDRGCSNRIANAIVERIRRAARNNEQFRVMVVMPLLPSFAGNPQDKESSSLRGVMYWQYRSICRGQHSIYHALFKEIQDPFEYLAFYGLRNHQNNGLQPQTEEVYIHSKIMIVDDRYSIIGSANINERSMKGDRDSEIAAIIEDSEFYDNIRIGGGLLSVGKFGHSLRMKLFEEHFGVYADTPMYNLYKDPVSLETWFTMQEHAMKNTQIYEHVFGCIPSDNILTVRQLELEHKKHVNAPINTKAIKKAPSIQKLLNATSDVAKEIGKRIERKTPIRLDALAGGSNSRNNSEHNTPRNSSPGMTLGSTTASLPSSSPPPSSSATIAIGTPPASVTTTAPSSSTVTPQGATVLPEPAVEDWSGKPVTAVSNPEDPSIASNNNPTAGNDNNNNNSSTNNNSEFGAAMNFHLRGDKHILETKNELDEVQGHIVYFPLKFLADEALEPKLFPAELYQ